MRSICRSGLLALAWSGTCALETEGGPLLGKPYAGDCIPPCDGGAHVVAGVVGIDVEPAHRYLVIKLLAKNSMASAQQSVRYTVVPSPLCLTYT